MLSPRDIVNLVYEKNLESDFMASLMMNKMNFSIGEIFDKKFVKDGDIYKLQSETYHLDAKVADDDIFTALNNGLYVTPFISRLNDTYRIHFMVHRYPVSMKAQYEEVIAKEVVKYMIFNTILALKLDTEEKVMDYCSKTR